MRIAFLRKITIFWCVFSLLFTLPVGIAKASNNEDEYVWLGGNVIGFDIKPKGVIVVDVCGVETDFGTMRVCEDMRPGDVINAINSKTIASVEELQNIVNESQGELKIALKRGKNDLNLMVLPLKESVSGEKKLGIKVKENVEGLGTVTCYDARGKFYALGHEVVECDSRVPIYGLSGRLTTAKVFGVEKGENGKPGSIKGQLGVKSAGIVTNSGEFGIVGCGVCNYNDRVKVKIASSEQVKMGTAQIYSEISGKPEFYNIKIVKVCSMHGGGGKNLIIKVVDEDLARITGGIVQGMSGSPIVQEGRIVGAVTHVFLNDPLMGYGAYIGKIIS